MADTGQGVLLEILQRNAESAAEVSADVRSLREQFAMIKPQLDDILRERAEAAKAAEIESKARGRILLAVSAAAGGLLSAGSGPLLDFVRALLAAP